jgi:predicted nucleotidyltransferase
MLPSIEQVASGVSIAAKEYPIKKAELFGSLASGQGKAGSDVDLLIEFTIPRVSLLTLNSLKYRLEELLGTKVDVIHGPLPKDSMIQIEKKVSVYGA